jgi:hypothetical protein
VVVKGSVLFGCEFQAFPIQKKKYVLNTFENEMVRRTFGPSDTFRHATLFLDNTWQ